MRITQEADYALRIVSLLAVSDAICGAAEIADRTGVPERFAHKILRKLLQGGVVRSYPGAKGGYILLRDPHELSMLDIIAQIDGPVEISKCADDDYICSRNGSCKENCVYHQVFRQISADIAEKMRKLTIAALTDPSKEISEILNFIT